MKFKEFAQIASPYLSGGQTEGEFVCLLLINFISDNVSDRTPPYSLDDSSLRSFYTGRRNMGRVARKILGHLDREKFNRYLSRFSVDTLELLSEKLKEEDSQLNNLTPQDCISQALLEALEESAVTRPGPKPKKGIDRLSIEKELRVILKGIEGIDAGEALMELEYKAVKVSAKVSKAGLGSPQDILLKSIERNVVLYYKFVENQIKLMEDKGTLDSEVFLKAVKSKYVQIKLVSPDAVTVYYSIREWLMEEAQSNDEIAADILTAFFIQNCEVFDVPPK